MRSGPPSVVPLGLIDRSTTIAKQGSAEANEKNRNAALIGQRRRRDPSYLAALARTHTDAALQRIIKLMNDDEQPGMVQIRCAEIILERGHGKTWQGVVLADATKAIDGVAAVPIMQRVQELLKASQEQGETTELEAGAVVVALDDDDLI